MSMDYETKLWLSLMFMYAFGSLVGWYITYQHFRAKEREREAVDNFKADQAHKAWRQSPEPLSYEQKQRNALSEMQRYCTEYIVKDEDKEWHYKYEPKED